MVKSLSCSLSDVWCCEIPASHPCLLRLMTVVPRPSCQALSSECAAELFAEHINDCNFFCCLAASRDICKKVLHFGISFHPFLKDVAFLKRC